MKVCIVSYSYSAAAAATGDNYGEKFSRFLWFGFRVGSIMQLHGTDRGFTLWPVLSNKIKSVHVSLFHLFFLPVKVLSSIMLGSLFKFPE